MSARTTPNLSKTRFAAGLQCLKRLYFECYQRDLADPVGPQQQALFDSGTAVGELARQRFPGGHLVQEDYRHQAEAERHTQELIADPEKLALYEAAFTFDGIRIRVDVLRRASRDSFDLIEVKSSTSVKTEHIPDVAIQLHVLNGAGITINKSYLMHIDNTYVYEGGDHNLLQLFALEDVTVPSKNFLASAGPAELSQMWEALQKSDPPTIETGPQCTKPYVCPFFGHCHQNEPEHAVRHLPSASAKLLEGLKRLGITDISMIPDGYSGLTAKQQRVRRSVITGQPYIGQGLHSALDGLKYPITFLDFETVNPAVPLYVGTRPYQQVPFQWSLHTLDSSGVLGHAEYLHGGWDDPRESLVERLLEALGPVGSIVVYTGFEEQRVRELAAAIPQYQDRLLSICGRLFDLHKMLSDQYYHPNFHGSYSIKAVLPALVPDMTYSDLEIQIGSQASVAFAQMIAPNKDEDEPERERIRNALLNYCQMDTSAMVRLLDRLQGGR